MRIIKVIKTDRKVQKKRDASVEEKNFGEHAKLRFVNGKPGIIFQKIEISSGGTSTPVQARQKVAIMKATIKDVEAAIAAAEKAQ